MSKDSTGMRRNEIDHTSNDQVRVAGDRLKSLVRLLARRAACHDFRSNYDQSHNAGQEHSNDEAPVNFEQEHLPSIISSDE